MDYKTLHWVHNIFDFRMICLAFKLKNSIYICITYMYKYMHKLYIYIYIYIYILFILYVYRYIFTYLHMYLSLYTKTSRHLENPAPKSLFEIKT